MEKEVVEALQAAPVRMGRVRHRSSSGNTGRQFKFRYPEEREYTATRVRPILAQLGYRSVLAVPILREEQIMGGLTVWRKEAGNSRQRS